MKYDTRLFSQAMEGGIVILMMMFRMISSYRPIIYTWSLVTAFIPIRYCAVGVSSFQFTYPSTFHLNQIATKRHQLFRQYTNLSPQSFVDEVTSFLDVDDIPYRNISNEELNGILQNNNIQSKKRVNEMMSLLDNHVILAVGKGRQTATTDSAQSTYSFILNLCPTTSLDTIIKQQHNSTNISKSVAAAAYLNSDLTKAFANSNTSIVHLHQDVWNRSPEIVQSRMRSKCGISQQRIYARKTKVKRITKLEYLPFLEENHLWGATGAKYGYSLYNKANDMLVAVATFSSKRKINRDNQTFHSFELLRFCTKLDTTVVGGITKLISAFVKEIKSNLSENTRIDIVTSIDRDFGSSTWPKFEQIEVMNPLPMFVGDDGLRRHAVGAGLTPLNQNIEDESSSMTTSELLRAGLPTSLMEQLDQDTLKESPWQLAAENGFHPVFDTGVERLVLIVDRKENEDTKQLWDNSMPRYVQQHYSPNKGVDQMLTDIRDYKKS